MQPRITATLTLRAQPCTTFITSLDFHGRATISDYARLCDVITIYRDGIPIDAITVESRAVGESYTDVLADAGYPNAHWVA